MLLCLFVICLSRDFDPIAGLELGILDCAGLDLLQVVKNGDQLAAGALA